MLKVELEIDKYFCKDIKFIILDYYSRNYKEIYNKVVVDIPKYHYYKVLNQLDHIFISSYHIDLIDEGAEHHTLGLLELINYLQYGIYN